MFVLGYQLALPGPMQRLSKRHPEVEWQARPVGRRWLVEGPAEGSPASTSNAPPRFVPRSPAERSFLEGLDRWDALALPPVRWRAGRLTVRLLAGRPSPPDPWRRRYPDAVLVAKRAVEMEELPSVMLTGSTPTLRLSRRQREVLDRAVRDGYYEVPRRTTVARIAESLGIGRSTAEEHLRAAESSVVRTAGPLALQWDEGAPAASTISTFARFSAVLDLYVWMAMREDRIIRVALARTRPAATPRERHPYLDRIVGHIERGTDDLEDLPVDLAVSDFDRAVLEEVRRIPPGSTASYQEIAQRVGRPRAARAVGNAVARNPALVVVPCHRVVPARGGLGEYSGEGGRSTKQKLLRQERVSEVPTS